MCAWRSEQSKQNMLISWSSAPLYLYVNWANHVTGETYSDLEPIYRSFSLTLLINFFFFMFWWYSTCRLCTTIFCPLLPAIWQRVLHYSDFRPLDFFLLTFFSRKVTVVRTQCKSVSVWSSFEEFILSPLTRTERTKISILAMTNSCARQSG